MPEKMMQVLGRLALCVLLTLAGPLAHASLENQVLQMINAADMGPTKVSVRLIKLPIDGRSPEPMVEIDDNQPMIPASNMKLLTTSAALKLLGPEFVFKTDLLMASQGIPTPAVVASPDADPDAIAMTPAPEGPALIIHGDGDPAFGDPELLSDRNVTFRDLTDHWVEAVQATGVTHFSQLIMDDRIFDQQFVHPDWPRNQLHRWYCAQVAGLNFHDNVLHVLPQPAHAQGLTAIVEVYPRMPFLRMTNRITTGSQDRFNLARQSESNEYIFTGTIRNRSFAPHQVTFNDAPYLFAQVIQDRLKQAGITVDAIVRPGAETVLPEATLLHRVQTALPVVLNRTNQNSMNLFAEALIKRMGRAVTGAPGSWDNGSAAIRQFLTTALGPGASIAQVADGSGMSRNNQVTARLMTDLLAYMYNDRESRTAFLSSLARVGVDNQGQRTAMGTLEKRMQDLKRGGYVYAKTGYINSVTSLSGYLVLARDDVSTPDVYAFSILINGWAGHSSYGETKNLQDRIVTAWQEALQNQ